MMAEPVDVAALSVRLENLERRYQQWAVPIDRALQDKFRRVNRDGYSGDDFRRDVEAIGTAQRVPYDPYAEADELLDGLCPAYLAATESQRQASRAAVANKRGVLSALLRYIGRAAQHLRAAGNREWLLRGLAAASIDDGRPDWRDLLLALAELYVAAEQTGIDPQPAFAAVGALSNPQPAWTGATPMAEILARFHTYAVLRERKHLS